MRKAEMSVNMIVVIVIALLILIILAFLIGGGFNNLRAASTCPGAGGICEAGSSLCTPMLDKSGTPLTCGGVGQVCCNPLG